ncbi:CPBP family intramembrane glutamic endopeptidase [Psychromonas algicola]|uniref:CPBP family intramembrane glutamic endopeptidase n=1 Tax=Psychromonas algicola TaxID=2555642 RepID=UPI001067FC6D|nr:CPBP family intramembrane glutamic endopeptidase [Psychromonas sp. RZ5]TEW44566.1 CPBP family intramembrane metalloprotease [Psychromonas sp. RZ5]
MTFYLLALSILCVFPYCKLSLFKQPLWLCLLLFSVISGCFEHYINEVGLLSIGFYLALYFGAVNIKQPVTRVITTTLFIITSLALALHWMPGFNNLPIVTNTQITDDAIAFTLYANVDKAIVGLLLCAYFFSRTTFNLTHNSTLSFKQGSNAKFTLPILIIVSTILATLTVALMIGLVSFNPKVPDFWLSFIAINLLFTCVAEEALFRGLLQTKLAQIITSKRFALLAPVMTACIFALAHFAGGLHYIFVAAVAGFGYSYIFYKTQRLEWAILCHWLVNVCHFFFFTYPMLSSA